MPVEVHDDHSGAVQLTILGSALLAGALLAALYAAGAGVYGGRTGDRRWVESARRSVYAMAALLTLAVVIIEAAFLRNDFSFALVADHSSTTTPTFYKLTAMWSSQEGSLLLWAWVLSLASSAVLFLTRNRHREIVPWAIAVLAGIGSFFVGLMIFKAQPFAHLDPAPVEGAGLTPLLRNPYMAVHPPMLYSGYVFWSIPFAFCVGALIARRLDASWIRTTRNFALLAWTFLGIGLLLGSRWSYEELGWGGYWGWDPVENAALMPWLVGTAFLHSVMVQEKRGMLKVWNVSLICGTFTLCLVGTFLVRSGVLQSIHAFGASTVGGPLLGLIAVVALGSTVLIVSRLEELRPERRIDSPLSRESIFLVNNLLLVGLAAGDLLGDVLPADLGVLHGREALAGRALVRPLRDPDRGSARPLHRDRPAPRLGEAERRARHGACCSGRALAALRDDRRPPGRERRRHPPLGALRLRLRRLHAGRAGGRVLARGNRPGARSPASRHRAHSPRRWGGTAAATAATSCTPGSRSRWSGSRPLRASRPTATSACRSGSPPRSGTTRSTTTTSPLTRSRSAWRSSPTSRSSATARRSRRSTPARNYYPTDDPTAGPIGRYFMGESTSEVGLRARASGDLWTAFQPDLSVLTPDIKRGNNQLAGLPPAAQEFAILALIQHYVKDPPPANFRVIVNPLVGWIWIGALIALAGAVMAGWPALESRRRLEAAYRARLGRELGPATPPS